MNKEDSLYGNQPLSFNSNYNLSNSVTSSSNLNGNYYRDDSLKLKYKLSRKYSLVDEQSHFIKSIYIGKKSKFQISKTNFCALITVLIVYLLYKNITSEIKFEHGQCLILSEKSDQLTRVYLYLSICYFISIVCNLIEAYAHKSLIYDLISMVFSFTSTFGQIIIELVYILIIGMSLMENEECGILKYLNTAWLVISISSILSYLYMCSKLYSNENEYESENEKDREKINNNEN